MARIYVRTNFGCVAYNSSMINGKIRYTGCFYSNDGKNNREMKQVENIKDVWTEIEVVLAPYKGSEYKNTYD